MARSPETITTMEPVSYGHRMVLRQEESRGAIFAAEYDERDSGLNFYWPVNPSLVRVAVEEVYEGAVEWSQERKGLWGSVKDGDFWFDSMSTGYSARAGIQPKIIDGVITEDALDRIVKLASKTTIENVSLPEDLSGQLKKFVASVLPPKPAK